MAKTSVVARNTKRRAMIDKYFERRQELKKIISSPHTTADEQYEAFEKLTKLPRNSSPVRYRKRCLLTGRGRGNLSYFGLCRNEFRRLAHQGEITGVTKSSW
jgi:small subunit ribosomal protein S14